MSLELTKEDMIQAAALGFERVLSRPENAGMIAQAVADALAARFEVLTPAEAAAMLGKAESTLLRNASEWGFDVSVTMGREGKVFFASQILEALHARRIKGREQPGKVTNFPTQQPTKAHQAPSQKAS